MAADKKRKRRGSKKSSRRAAAEASPPASPAPEPERRRYLVVGTLVLMLAAAGGGYSVYSSLPDVRRLMKAPPRTTAFIELRRQQASENERPFALRWNWRSLAQISPYLQHAAVRAEDARFWKHEGVDWDAIEEAAEANWKRGRIAVGGSTITQQVAKNLYLSPSKNPVRKLREVLIARRLEEHLPKPRLLEIYLNIAEWGDGIFGAEAAAQRWYGTSAAALSPAQAARLAVALPSPKLRAPSVASRDLARRAARLVQEMLGDRLIDRAGYERALADLGVRNPVSAHPETPRFPAAAL
jgi:monofunctional glycosyltransferase